MAQTAGSKQVQPAPSADVIAFLNFSRKLTGHNELLGCHRAPHSRGRRRRCRPASPAYSRAGGVQQRRAGRPGPGRCRRTRGAQEHALAINAVWYTGTVVGPTASQVVSYQEALMLRIVGATVARTHLQLNGPLWWTQAARCVMPSVDRQRTAPCTPPTRNTPMKSPVIQSNGERPGRCDHRRHRRRRRIDRRPPWQAPATPC